MLPLIEAYPPPATKGKYIKIKYVTQLPNTQVPSFVFSPICRSMWKSLIEGSWKTRCVKSGIWVELPLIFISDRSKFCVEFNWYMNIRAGWWRIRLSFARNNWNNWFFCFLCNAFIYICTEQKKQTINTDKGYMEAKAEILLVDDHALVLEGMRRMLESVPDVRVADAVTSGQSCRADWRAGLWHLCVGCESSWYIRIRSGWYDSWD